MIRRIKYGSTIASELIMANRCATAVTVAASSILWLVGIWRLISWITSLGFGVLFILSCLINLMVAVLTHLTFPVGILLTLIICAVIIGGSILTVGILACGLYSCPNVDSFKPWLQTFMTNTITSPTPPIPETESKQISLKSYTSSIGNRLMNYYGPSLMVKALTAKMTVKYFNLGFCRLAFCSDIGTEGKEVIFIGIFNTWFPYK